MSLNLKFGVSTWLWTSPFTTETIGLFPKIKAMGFDTVEIPVEYPERIDAKKVRDALTQNGLEAIVCGVFDPARDLTNDDLRVQGNCFEYILQCLDFCNTLGANFFGGPMYSAAGKARMISPDQREKEWDRAVANLHKVCKLAQERGLDIALEPLNRFESDMINTAEDVLRLVNDVNHLAAKVMLDAFHMTIEERNIELAITSVGGRLIHLQVAENHRGTPGTGQIAWDSFRQGLTNVNYDGVISIESVTPDAEELAGAVRMWKNLAPSQDGIAEEGIRFLKKVLDD